MMSGRLTPNFVGIYLFCIVLMEMMTRGCRCGPSGTFTALPFSLFSMQPDPAKLSATLPFSLRPYTLHSLRAFLGLGMVSDTVSHLILTLLLLTACAD